MKTCWSTGLAVAVALALAAGGWAATQAVKCTGIPTKKPYCSKCDKTLASSDLKGKKCKADETDTVLVDVCIISSYIPTCHPNKATSKPTS